MNKLLLWVCVGIGGAIGSLLPMMWSSDGFGSSVLFSMFGSIVGIWFWYKYLRFI